MLCFKDCFWRPSLDLTQSHIHISEGKKCGFRICECLYVWLFRGQPSARGEPTHICLAPTSTCIRQFKTESLFCKMRQKMWDEREDDPKLWGGHAIQQRTQLTSDTKWVRAAKKWWSNSYQIWNGRITENISFHETFLAFERSWTFYSRRKFTSTRQLITAVSHSIFTYFTFLLA